MTPGGKKILFFQNCSAERKEFVSKNCGICLRKEESKIENRFLLVRRMARTRLQLGFARIVEMIRWLVLLAYYLYAMV